MTTDAYRRDGAKGQIENALSILKGPAPLDPVMRRAEYQRVAGMLYQAADLLTDFGEPEVA